MRTPLHAPRHRKRSIAAATLGALAMLGSLLVAAPAQALNDTGTGGVFVPAAGRVFDSGKTAAMPAKTWQTMKVTGKNGIPDDGTVGAISVVATAANISKQGALNGRPNADTPSTLMGIYGGDGLDNTSFSSVLAVNSDGTIQLSPETSARILLDVQGYYTSNNGGTAAGGFVPMNGTRIADTRSGQGLPKQVLASGDQVDLQVTGTAGVPKGASGVIINMIAVNQTAATGYLTPYATGDTRPSNSFQYAASAPTSMQAQVKLSSAGKITLWNGYSNIHLVVEVQGYFTAAGKGGALFTPGTGRAYDTRTNGNTPLANNETRSIQIAGKAGIPVMGSGVNAVVLTLTSLKSTAGGGSATVWADGTTRPGTTAINFEETTIRTNTITVPLGVNGKIAINNVADPTNYVFDIQGWYRIPNETTELIDAYVDGLNNVSDETSREQLRQFNELTIGEQQQFVLITSSSTYTKEFLDVDMTSEGTVDSKAYPGTVQYEVTSSVSETPSGDADPTTSEGMSTRAAPKLAYKKNSTATASADAVSKILGIEITKLVIYCTFKTDGNAIPKSVVSSSAGIRNYNPAVQISYTLDTPYLQTPERFAVASATWHGNVLIKGVGAQFDKRHVGKWGQVGLVYNKIWNI